MNVSSERPKVNAMNGIIPLTYKTIPRILCATDLSPRCESAVRRATLLAKQMDALLLRAIDCDVLIASMSAARSSCDSRPRLALPDAAAAQWPAYW